MRATPGSSDLSQRAAAVRGLGIVALCALLAAPAPGAAQSAACEDAGSTAAMRRCEIERLKRADAGMSAAYRALSAKLDRRGREKLRAAQEAWLRFRTAEARFQADSARGGTLAPLIAESVQADMTESRRKRLEDAARRLK
jgi:uncharacterized protein YecT (DUF1311 family)